MEIDIVLSYVNTSVLLWLDVILSGPTQSQVGQMIIFKLHVYVQLFSICMNRFLQN